jgi:uncharacterized damage-inducible protein DinB
MSDDLRYPIGEFNYAGEATPAEREKRIDAIAGAPGKLREAVNGLKPSQIETRYRPGGWTVRQVVHHVADSHMNSYIRFKLALTENTPTVKVYDEAKWANLQDVFEIPIDASLDLLDALTPRWVSLLRSLADSDFKKTFNHPEAGITSLDKALAMYAWHGAHHIAHITELKKREGW